MRIPFSYVWRSLWARRLTTVLTLGGLRAGEPDRSWDGERAGDAARDHPGQGRPPALVAGSRRRDQPVQEDDERDEQRRRARRVAPGVRAAARRPHHGRAPIPARYPRDRRGAEHLEPVQGRRAGCRAGVRRRPLDRGRDRRRRRHGVRLRDLGGRGPADAGLRPPRVLVGDVSPARSGSVRRRQSPTPGRSTLPVSGAQARAGVLPRAVAGDGQVHQDPRARRDHHLQRRCDDRRHDHDVRRGCEPGRRGGDAARPGVPAPQRVGRVPGRVGAAGAGRWGSGRGARLAARLRPGLDPELRELLGDRVRVRAVAGRRHARPGLRRGHGCDRRIPPGGPGRTSQHRQRAAGVVAGGESRRAAPPPVKLTALAAHTPEAVRAALAARGWDTQPAWFAATGMQALVVLLDEITEAEREALVRWGAKAGADVLTGEGWALVGAPASRLAPLARPDRLPPGLERLAPELGRFLAGYADPPRRWVLGGGGLSLDHPVLIGIVNVTPASFSDGGRFATLDRAVAQAERLVADGCELLDVGGESTRPGAAPVPVEEEIGRVAPVIEQIVRRGLGPVSVGAGTAAVARVALAA